MRHEGSGANGSVTSEVNEAATVQKPILLAQVGGTPSAPQPLPLPAAEQVTRLQPLPFGGGIEASAYALPNGAAFDRIRVVEIDGRLVLALVQPDGSVIVLEGTGPVTGSTTEFEIPNLIVGDVEVPRDALQAAFLDNGIVPAAGETVSPSSGFNGDEPFPGIGDGLGVSPLLPPTELAFDAFEPRELGDDFGARNGLLGLTADLGNGSAGNPDGGLLPPSFVSGVIGSGGGGDGGGGDGDGEGGTGGPGGGGNQGNGFMRLDQSAIAGGNQVNAGGVATLTNQVVILAGSNDARLVFGSLAFLETNSNGVGDADLVWQRDPEQPDTRILGYVDRDGDGLPGEDELAVVIAVEGAPAGPGTTSTYTVTVTLLQGLPDPQPGPGENGIDTDGFDLGNIQLAIVDGQYTILGEIDVVVLDDVPVQTEGSTRPNIVDEDALPGGNGDSGAPGENNSPDPNATASGSLGGLVSVGSDRITPGSDAPFFFVKPLEGAGSHALAGVTSKGGIILLSQVGNVLTGFVEGNSSDGYQPAEGVGSQDRAVFTLTVAADGGYTFTLLDQIDHPPLTGAPGDDSENELPVVIDLSGHVGARDSDFDTITLAPGSLAFQVLDDIPVARPPAAVSEMTFTFASENSGYANVLEILGRDGATGSVEETAGSTASVAFDAADATPGRFALNTGNNGALARVQIFVDDGDGVFERGVDQQVGGERFVDALTWEELAAASQNGARDLFLAFDDDGANLDGDFDDLVVRVDTDRVPTALVSARVEEDAMSGPLGQPGFPDGSTGNGDAGDDVTGDEASGSAGSLQALFRVGADEDLVIGVADAVPEGLPRLLSKGEEIDYVVSGNRITGVASGDREVFTLDVRADGSWDFDLKDQLDHVPGDAENTRLVTVGGGEVAGIDLSRLITGTDVDGDTVVAAAGAFVIRVQDDIPIALAPSPASLMTFTFVAEESGYANVLEIQGRDGSSGSIEETAGDTATVAFDVTDGTAGRFTLNTGNNSALARVQVFVDDGDGVFERGVDQMVGGNRSVDGLTWEELAAVSENGTRDLFLAFDDDGAGLDGDFNDLVVRVDTDRVPTALVSARTEEDGMSGPAGQPGFPDGSTGNKGPGDDNTQDEASGSAGSLRALFSMGADEDLTIGVAALVPAGLPRLMSKGEEIEYVVSGNSITAIAGGDRDVFTLVVNSDGSWAFDLRDQLDHAPGAGENTRLITADGDTVVGIDLSRMITGTDHDGDTVTAAAGTFVIQVEDDVPAALPASMLGGALFTSIFEESGYFNVLEIQGAAGSAGTVDETPGDSALVVFDPADERAGNFVLNTGHDGPATGVQVWIDDGDGLFNRDLDQLRGPPQAVGQLTWNQIALASDSGRKDLFLALDDAGANVDGDFNDIVVRVQSVPRIMVEEDGMSGPAGQAGFPDSWTGNKDIGDDNGQDEATGGPGSLTALFRSGSDEGLIIGLRSTTPDAGLPRLMSLGEEVLYVVEGNTVTALAGDREVFSLTVQPDGSWAFDLRDQLDHVAGAGESTILRTVDGGSVAGIDLSGLLIATDQDGDTVSGMSGAFVIGVQDDLPVFAGLLALADDPIVAGTAGDDVSLVGSTQNDVIDALSGDDWLYGLDGDDILIGNLGSDTLSGGTGADTFKLTDLSAQDLIADYGTGTDRIDLTALFTTGTDGPASPTELLEFVRYEDGALSVDADGTGDAHGFVQVAFVDTAGPAVAPPPSIQIVYDDQSHQVQTANLTG